MNEMYKGIEVTFSEHALRIMPESDDRTVMLDHFFSKEPINSIRWVSEKELRELRITNAELPMYSIKNSINDMILLWPMIEGSDLHLFVESVEERPDLIGQLNHE